MKKYTPASLLATGALAAAALAACGGSDDEAASTPSTPTVTQTSFELQMEASRLNLGSDAAMDHWRSFYCNLSDDNNAIVIAQRQRNSIRMPLTQILDDVWYIGSEYVGQYFVRDANGFVMIDAGNNAAEMTNYDLPALTSLGMDPTTLPLHGVLVTHGHGDHDGGAAQLKASTGAPIYLGSADATGKAYAPITLDSARMEPYDITVGGQTITVLSTPGHTAGATGFVVRAHDGGKEVKLFVSGGSSLSANNVPLITAYLDSMERTYKMIKDMKVDTASNPHVYWDGSRDLIQKIQAEGKKTPSQFIIGNKALLRAMAIGRTCTASWLAKQDPTVQIPVWRVSEVEFMPGSPSPTRLVARVSNGWGPLAGQTVSFAKEGGAALCTAQTGNDGVATCNPPAGAVTAATDRIVAQYAGKSSSSAVDLGDESTAVAEELSVGACRDLAQARAISGARIGDSKYVGRLDVNGDGLINLRDIEAVAQVVPAGTTCP